MPSIKDLEKAAMLQILYYLYEVKEAMRTEIGSNVKGSSGTIGSSLRVLSEMGLLEERREPPYKRYISLSPLGLKVAQHVNEIHNTFQS